MAEDDSDGGDGGDEEDEGPVVELGEGDTVEGMPLARVLSRQTWGIEKSRLRGYEGDAVIRTPNGPQRLGDVLDSIDAVYFARRQDLAEAVESAVGLGPIPTASDERDTQRVEAGFTSTGSGESDDDAGSDSGSESSDGPDANLDPETTENAEARAASQGDAHAETSTDADPDETTGETDAAADGDSDEPNEPDEPNESDAAE